MTRLTYRPYQSEEDFWNIRAFLREVFLVNDRHEISWSVARWDYWRWHGIKNLGDGKLEEDVTIWMTNEGRIAAVLNRENAGHGYLQVHPAFKSPELEEEMIARAEERLAVQRAGGRKLLVWCDSTDQIRQQVLTRRGYSLVQDKDEHHWRRGLDQPIPQYAVPEGYVLRALGDSTELASRSWASWRSFHPNEPDEKYANDLSWYLNIQEAPLYRRDLDLVAVTEAGDIAAFTTIWYDDVTRWGYFEPVGTVPEHQKRGLARALLSEGMRRLKIRGATLSSVGGEAPHANALYRSVFGPEHDLSRVWEKHGV